MHPTITCKLKSSEKNFSIQFYPQNYDFAIFVPNIYKWLLSPFHLLQQQSLWTGKRIKWFLILLFFLQAWKKKKTQIQIYAFLNDFSILTALFFIFFLNTITSKHFLKDMTLNLSRFRYTWKNHLRYIWRKKYWKAIMIVIWSFAIIVWF